MTSTQGARKPRQAELPIPPYSPRWSATLQDQSIVFREGGEVAVVDTLELRKERGAFFTPPIMSRFIADWAIRSPTDTVLEPSCGEASFLLEAAARLRSLGSLTIEPHQLHGIELHEASARAAAKLMKPAGVTGTIVAADFFDVKPEPRFDAVIGNPPYIRYQQFSGASRTKGLEAALAHGVRLNGLASSWAAFTVHAAHFLKPGGRLGLVLPAELLSVSYASRVRTFLLERFAHVRLVLFEELVFPGVLAEVVLLLAEGEGPAPGFEVLQVRDLDGLGRLGTGTGTSFSPSLDEKWTPALLPSGGASAYRKIASSPAFSRLVDWGETYLGAVTGNNRYFTLTADDAKLLGLPRSELLRISPPGSRHLRGLTFSEKAWEELANEQARIFLFAPDPKRLSQAASLYIANGEAAGVSAAFKCRTRSPWYRVPLVRVPDLLMTYMDQDRPRLVSNDAGVHVLNSLYGVILRHGRRELGRELIPLACMNSLTLLGAELLGRSYGGGILKIEPREADALPIPSLATVEAAAEELRALKPQLGTALRSNNLDAAVRLVDRVLLVRHLKISSADLTSIREARSFLHARRATRGKGSTRGIES